MLKFRATLKPYYTWTIALLLSIGFWAMLIYAERAGDLEQKTVWVNGNLWTAIFFALPFSQVITKMFGRVAGPSRNRLAHLLLGLMDYILAFAVLTLLLFAISAPMISLFRAD